MLIETLSVFPEMFEPVMSTSILGRARKAGLFDFKAYNLRDWTHDRHRTVDDEPYGGGQGMLMKVEPIAEAIEAISAGGPKPTVVFFTPCGEPFTQHVAERLLKSERLLFVCSRYEGVDERFGSLGTIVEIMSTPANDVWVVEGDRYGEVLIPVIEQVVLDLPDTGTISVHVMDGLIDMDK